MEAVLGPGGDSWLQCALVQVKPQAMRMSLFAHPGKWECWRKAPGEVELAKRPGGAESSSGDLWAMRSPSTGQAGGNISASLTCPLCVSIAVGRRPGNTQSAGHRPLGCCRASWSRG